MFNNCLYLQRGDSVDTIFVSSPPLEYERTRAKHKLKKRSSPRRRTIEHQSRDESSDQETSLSQNRLTTPNTMRSYRELVVADDIGNFSEMSQSVVLDIDNSSNSSSNESHIGEGEYNDVDGNDDEDDDDELHCDDWEIRMLAAELNRRESKKEEISSDGGSDPDEAGRLLRRRRRKPSSNESVSGGGGGGFVGGNNVASLGENYASEAFGCSDNENDQLTRPRAASLDQHNIRRQKCKGVFKAMSFDRDKDRL